LDAIEHYSFLNSSHHDSLGPYKCRTNASVAKSTTKIDESLLWKAAVAEVELSGGSIPGLKGDSETMNESVGEEVVTAPVTGITVPGAAMLGAVTVGGTVVTVTARSVGCGRAAVGVSSDSKSRLGVMIVETILGKLLT
jgi:hypothetical protein